MIFSVFLSFVCLLNCICSQLLSDNSIDNEFPVEYKPGSIKMESIMEKSVRLIKDTAQLAAYIDINGY